MQGASGIQGIQGIQGIPGQSAAGVVLTRGSVSAGTSSVPTILSYDINNVNYVSGAYDSVILPIVTDANIGKTILVRTSNVPAGSYITVKSAASVYINFSDANSAGSPYNVHQNSTCKFTYVGSGI